MSCCNPQPVGPVALKGVRPCGVCIDCRFNYARSKAVRAVHELQFWDCASFVTLTYDNENLPYNDGAVLPTLVKSDLQNFWKRLRKKLRKKIAYMASGEYGDERQRPHYHAIIFGENFFEDRRPSKMSADYFESELLDELWQHQGACVIGDVTFDSANYVAGYTVKKLNGKYGVEAYENMGRIPPFGCMSTKPAIGKRWVEKHLDELVQHDTVIVNGAEQQPPRYYDEYVKKWCPDTYREIKNARVARSRERLANGVAGQSIAGTKTRQNFVARKNSTL